MAGTGKKADGTGRNGSTISEIPAPLTRGTKRIGLNSIVGADTAWMSPGQPIIAQEQNVAGRQYDYQVALNLNIRPRAEEAISFWELRGLAESYSLVRLAIETRKDQLVKLDWKIKPIDPKQKPDARCDELNEFFKSPDKRHSWQEWIRILTEDLLVIDAPAIYMHPNYGKMPYAFEVMDGATFKVLIQPDGRVPLPPQPAYQQNLKGIPAVDYITPSKQHMDMPQLIYKPRNPRSWKLYGYSPVEQIIMIVNIGLRREISQLQFYTEGNVPESIISVPATWTPTQVKEFQAYWDSILEGNTASRRHAKFVPGGMDVHDIKTAALTDAFDEWLARVVMYCFSLPASPFTKQVNRATAETAKEQASEEGLTPLMGWWKDLINYLIQTYWGYTDIGFDWVEEKSVDPLVQAQIHDLYLKNGTLMTEEVRADLGLEAFTPEQEAQIAAEKVPPSQAPEQPDGEDPDENPPSNKPGGGKPKGDKAPAPNPTKITDKAAHVHGLKKKTYAKLSAANVKRANKLAGAYTKFFKKIKPGIIKQAVTAYARVKKADDNSDTLAETLELDFTAILQVTAQNLSQAAQEGVDKAVDNLADYNVDFDTSDIAEGVGNYRAAEMVGKRYNADGDLVDNPNAKFRIDEGTRQYLAADIDNAMKEGWSTDQLADVLEDNYAFSVSRAETIARTEIARADVAGSMKTYKDSGVVTGKKWLLAEDPCPICEENANDGIIDLDDNFTSGDDAPPAHPNCECDVSPVVGEDEDNNDNEEE